MEAVGTATTRRGRPRTLVRHVTGRLAGAAIYGILGMMLFLTVAQFVVSAPQDIGRGMPIGTSLMVHVWQMPIHGVNGAWLAMLAAQLMVLGAMSRQREYMALLASGISVYQLCVPVLFVATMIALGVFAAQEALVPLGHERTHVAKDQYRATSSNTGATTLNDVTYFASRSRTFLFGSLDMQTSTATDIQMHRTEKGSIVEAVTADRGTWDTALGSWRLYDVLVRQLDRSQRIISEQRYPEVDSEFRASPQELRFETLLGSGKYELSYFSIANLQRRIEALQRSGQISSRLMVAYYRKWAAPSTVIVIALIAMPGALSLGRAGIGMGIARIVFLCCGYQAFNEVCMVLGNAEKISPMLAAWLAHIAGAGLGLIMLTRTQT